MGMSTYVRGFRPPDDRFGEMKRIWDACKAADIDPPEDVDEFFENEPPDILGTEVEIEDCKGDFETDYQNGFEINLNDLAAKHPEVTVIRFWNSW